MMVTFVSQCEKKALGRTRRVLDSFANRIGDNTWQTVITAEGLQAVKKLLRKTASKSTAVSCFWIRSRSRSEFIWCVGNKDKFNSEGIVPVNFTNQKAEQFMDKHQWKTLTIIKNASAIAGLFHDFGKVTMLFQKKINPDEKTANYEPYRHEWISYRLFQAFVGTQTDAQWLESLTDIQQDAFDQVYKDRTGNTIAEPKLTDLPSFAQLVAWLILAHHKLPLYPNWKDDKNNPPSLNDMPEWLEKNFTPVWNSPNCEDEDQQNRIEENWQFCELPVKSMQWRSKACEFASDAKVQLTSWLHDDQNWLHEQLFTSHLSRLCLILADHYYSSLTFDKLKEIEHKKWCNPNYKVYANTDWVDGKQQYKQQLDEHLIGVAHYAKDIVKQLPRLGKSLKSLERNDYLIKNVGFSESDKDKKNQLKEIYGWQDEARKLIEKIGDDSRQNGFFGINMASTGKGKTRANAKIMTALGMKTGRVRFSVALGLRVLTLQTGKEYQDELKLSKEDLAIAVGGTAVKQLFEYQQTQAAINTQADKKLSPEASGSESQEEMIDKNMYVHYSGDLVEHSLKKWTKKQKGLAELLCAPVLVSTIDHLIPATEGTKGAKQIPATLRLLTSDLVLDEPDDFGLSDLPALCRLVHWAGMLGSRILLSTATIPPAMAYALFQAYQAGWEHYAKANVGSWKKEIVCAWFDENDRKCDKHTKFDAFKKAHDEFVKQRVKYLKKLPARRRAEILEVNKDSGTAIEALSHAIQSGSLRLHQDHAQSKDGKHISIGLVRMANIKQMVAVAKTLLKSEVPEINGEKVHIHYCIYHSRYPLAIRAAIEEKLDRLLNRKEPDNIWQQAEIQQTLEKDQAIKHHIFIVLASPVAEVGRDHDYDWAIVEPSSMRSIIQLAGRVLRHREAVPDKENILILSHNHKALKGKKICFNRPGFESDDPGLNNHDMKEVLSSEQYQIITAIHRIVLPKSYQKTESGKYINLVELEHKALAKQFFKGGSPANVWWEQSPQWCGEVQRQQRFRDAKKDEAYYLWLENEYTKPKWCWKNEAVYPAEFGDLNNVKNQVSEDINLVSCNHFWFDQGALGIYQQLAQHFKSDLPRISKRFGEVRVTEFNSNGTEEYNYHPCLGLYQDIEE